MIAALLITCASLAAVDGDTIRCDGVRMRDMGDGAPYVEGYDAPELRDAGCSRERRLAERATRRMAQLLQTPGLTITDSGARDRFERPLVSIRLPDGRSIGSILISEGLAKKWTPRSVPQWCQSTRMRD